MKKNNENKFNEYVIRIGGTLIRTITLTPYDWGIGVVVKEKADHERNYAFSSRNFHYTEKYQTTEQLVRRIEKYYKIHVGKYYQPYLYSDDGTNIDWTMPTEMASFWVWRTKRELIACMESWGYERKDYVIQAYEDDNVEAYSVIDEDGCVTFSIEIN